MSSPRPDRDVVDAAERMRTILEAGDEALKPTLPPAATSQPHATDSPRRIGRYRIERLVASGGMGRVWSAFDETLERNVALKDVRPDVSHDDNRRRFLDEAKITARLEHPGIIPVYDMPDGSAGDDPTYVMRFVHGKTLARALGEHHHRRRNGAPDPVEFFQLVQAFRSICQTVAYAHSQNVLHRDLKPANVLLGDFGETLVLDWGLAKAAPQSAAPTNAAASATETQAGQIMGSPAYMSPEQANAEPQSITARSDVWSLGVILYELLTGQVPFHADNLHDILAKVRNDAPAKPSAIDMEVPRGLEAICLKSLCKNPDDRYASAADLADDVARWLADEPVHAYPEPWSQRAARWARRHKAIVASTAVLLVSSVVALSIGAFFIERQRARAEANLKTALDVVDAFFVTVSENRLLDEPGMQPLRAELLTSAVAFAEKFAAENAGDPARQADLARVKLLYGRLQTNLRETDRARTALTDARAAFAMLAQTDPSPNGPRKDLAQASLSLGYLERDKNPAAAAEWYRDAIEQYQQLRKSAPESPELQERHAKALNNLAMLKASQEKFDEAGPMFENAIAIADELTKAAPTNVNYADQLAGYHANFAGTWMARNKISEARKHLDKSLAIRERLAKQGARGLDLEDSMADSQNHLGSLAMRERRASQAEQHFGKALALRTALALRNPDVPKWQTSLARAHYSLSQVQAAQRRYDEAFAAIDRCNAILADLVKDAPDEPGVNFELGRGRLLKAYFLYDSKNLPAAEDEFTSAIESLEKARTKDPARGTSDLVNAYWTRAMVRVDRSRFAEAVADYDRAIQLDPGPQRAALTKERDAAARKAMK